MNFKEYTELAARTDKPMSLLEGLSHAALMLHSEIDEIMLEMRNGAPEAVAKEIGDALWAVSKIARLLGIETLDLWSYQPVNKAANIAGRVQKVYQGHEAKVDLFQTMLGETMAWLSALALQQGVTLEQCAVINIEKLKARYPDGFSAERSINREG